MNKISSDSIYSADEVRSILDADNTEIKNLCKKLNLYPRRDANSGKTFFLKEDVEVMRFVKNLYEKSRMVEKALTVPSSTETTIKKSFTEVAGIIQDGILSKIAKVFEEKFSGFDDIVLELVRSKTEIERLKHEKDNLLKENFELKESLEEIKPVGFGFYKREKR